MLPPINRPVLVGRESDGQLLLIHDEGDRRFSRAETDRYRKIWHDVCSEMGIPVEGDVDDQVLVVWVFRNHNPTEYSVLRAVFWGEWVKHSALGG